MTQMPGLSLIDIGVPTEQVQIGDKFLTVNGLPSEDIFELFQRFPDAVSLLGGTLKVTNLSPALVSAVIAAGSGSSGDAKSEALARRLPAESQLDILEAIGRLTFKSGFGPFVDRLTAILNAAASENSGKEMGTNSPLPLKPSSPPDSTTEPSGN